MIYGLMHRGSGLGNQLHRYIATRVLALDKGYEFSMIAPDLFKGNDFLHLNMGYQENPLSYSIQEPSGETKPMFDIDILPVWKEDTKYYNPDFNFISDHTIIDGEFQDERYFEHRLPEIRKWLRTEMLDMPNDLCVINFRGGEYQYFPELFLTQDYWDEAIRLMKTKRKNLRFEVHTDDPILAKKFFPEYPIVANMQLNWRSIRYAKYLILSNSSFAIIPALINENAREIIAPKYWNRRNVGKWEYPCNYYKKFSYI